jgi:CubicO group peptidase (beta-lactamase class C family)
MDKAKEKSTMKYSSGTILLRLAIASLLIGFVPAMAAFEADHLSAATEKGMDLWHVPGMSVAVVTQDEILLQKGFGNTAAKNGQPVDQHTLFAIASTTKAMVVTGILILVDEGKLSLDDPITKHIPELHFADPMLTEQLMVRDLLAHRTGLPSTDYWTFFQDMPLGEQISRLQTVKSAAPVRTRLIYQNTMFEIAGLLIERLSGQRWHHFLNKRLWQPIGMQETYGAREQIGAEQTYVTPHLYLDKKLSVPAWDFPADYADAAGSVWSSIHDMSLWAQFLLRDGVTSSGDRLVSEESISQMFEPHQLASTEDFYPTTKLTQPNWRSYGLAWFQQDFQGRKIDFHTGSLSGLIAIIGLDRASDKAVIVLGNRDHAEMRHALLWEVMDNTDGDSRRDWNQDVFDLYEKLAVKSDERWEGIQKKRIKKTKPSLAKSAYVGTYRSETMGDTLIEKSGRNMTLETTRVSFEMTHWHLDTFLVEYKNWQMKEFVKFSIGADGTLESFKLMGETFERVTENPGAE